MRSWIAALLLTATAAAPPRSVNPPVDPGGPTVPALCAAPWGVDLCAATGVTTAFAIPTDWGAADVPAGSWWTPLVGWATNAPGGLPGVPLSYRDGYATRFRNDPMQDFVSKLVRLRVVVDPGTSAEHAYEIADPARFARLATIADFWGSGNLGPPEVDAGQWMAYVPMLRPLAVGAHEVHVVYTLSAESCDGFPSFAGEPLSFEGGHCLPAGDFAMMPVWHPYHFSFAARAP